MEIVLSLPLSVTLPASIFLPPQAISPSLPLPITLLPLITQSATTPFSSCVQTLQLPLRHPIIITPLAIVAPNSLLTRVPRRPDAQGFADKPQDTHIVDFDAVLQPLGFILLPMLGDVRLPLLMIQFPQMHVNLHLDGQVCLPASNSIPAPVHASPVNFRELRVAVVNWWVLTLDATFQHLILLLPVLMITQQTGQREVSRAVRTGQPGEFVPGASAHEVEALGPEDVLLNESLIISHELGPVMLVELVLEDPADSCAGTVAELAAEVEEF